MISVETYSLVLLFYVLIGTAQGLGNASLAAKREGKRVERGGWYLLCGGVSFVYAWLGLGVFHGGLQIYVFIPVLIIWWAGLSFGATLFPITDYQMATFVFLGMVGALFIYHGLL